MSGVIFLIVFVLINLWAILTKNDSNSFLAGIAGMCLVTGIMYLRKGKKESNSIFIPKPPAGYWRYDIVSSIHSLKGAYC